MSDIVVIGGGVVGMAAAYQLARAGVAVTLVDRQDEGQATAAGAGIISPATSTSAPVPFITLAFEATNYYPVLMTQLAEDGEHDTGYAVCGGLFVATNEAEAARLPEHRQLIEARRAAGLQNPAPTSLLDSGEAQRLFPALAALPAAIYLYDIGRVNGRLLRDALRRAAIARGASIMHGNATIIRDHGRVTGVRVGQETIAAGAIIVAGGAWSNALGDALGVRLPVYPQRGQILHLDMPGAVTTAWPVVNGFHSHYLLAFADHRIVAGATREHDAGYDYRMTAGGVHEALGEALRVAPGLHPATLHEVRIGLRPASPDNLPILGQLPGHDNVYVATGHGASGLMLGPHSGATVADLAQGKDVGTDLSPFGASRFVR